MERHHRSTTAFVDLVADGLLEAAGQRRDLTARLDELAALVDEHADPTAHARMLALVDELREAVPGSTGGIVTCRTCGQVGRAVELLRGHLVWVWSGASPSGAVVHPFRVVESRRVGDVPPWRCPDHERRGAPRVGRTELERRAAR